MGDGGWRVFDFLRHVSNGIHTDLTSDAGELSYHCTQHQTRPSTTILKFKPDLRMSRLRRRDPRRDYVRKENEDVNCKDGILPVGEDPSAVYRTDIGDDNR